MTTETTGRGEPAPAVPASVLTPVEEAMRAIEQTRDLLADAIAALENGGDEHVVRAYECAAGCTNYVARALWFLRRVEREREAHT